MVLNRKSLSKLPSKIKNWLGKNKKIILIFLALPVFIILLFTFYNIYFIGRIFPNTYIAGVSVGGLTPKETSYLIEENTKDVNKLVINNHDSFDIDLDNLGFSYDLSSSINAAYKHARNESFLNNMKARVLLLNNRQEFDLVFTINEEKLDETLSIVAGQAGVPAVYPSVNLVDGVIVVGKGRWDWM